MGRSDSEAGSGSVPRGGGKLGVEPGDCLVIEDSVNGVLAARAAGMAVWGFVGGRHHDAISAARLLAAGAERLVADWDEGGALLAEV